MAEDRYENPLSSRYASPEMLALWGAQKKFSTWRRLWLMLATAQHELGLDVTAAQLAEMRQHLDDINFESVSRYEKQLRHDVMAHVHAFGDLCPTARPIIHWGATSCYVTDNADLMLMRDGLEMIKARLAKIISLFGDFALRFRDTACLAFTHFQPAQPTTIGKRACLWCYDFVMDLESLEYRTQRMRARGAKGTTGTQASFLKLFGGDHQRVRDLDEKVAQAMGFSSSYAVTGQTYSRKVDVEVIDVLSSIAQSAHKFAVDMRLLASRKEIEEPFEKDQVGSSAMAYKRNPMRSERICSLARFAINLQANVAQTYANQWLERTLDDSANRRLVLPQAFLAIDAILILVENIVAGMVVYEAILRRNLEQELPFMVTENILMAAVEQGGDRQSIHEVIRQHSHAAAYQIKMQGGENDLLDRLRTEPTLSKVALDTLLDPKTLVGRSPEQVTEFIESYVEPVRNRYQQVFADPIDIRV